MYFNILKFLIQIQTSFITKCKNNLNYNYAYKRLLDKIKLQIIFINT